MNNREYILTTLQTYFPDAEIQVHDPMHDDQHLVLTMISDCFDGMLRIQRHRLVMDKISSRLHSEALHAISLKLYSTKESININRSVNP